MLSDPGWKIRPVLCFHLNPLGGVGSSSSKQLFPEHYHVLNVFYSDYRCSTSLQKKKPLNKIKCFHIKSFDRGMLKPDLPGDCHTKSFSASSKYC